MASYDSIIHPEDRKTVRGVDTGSGQRKGAFELTYRIRTREGSVKWVLERGRSIAGADGATRQFEGFIMDVTERKLLEAQVIQGQRLESVGTLAGGIAHDLNNVFAPIMMAGDLLAEKIADKDTSQLLNVIAMSAEAGRGARPPGPPVCARHGGTEDGGAAQGAL